MAEQITAFFREPHNAEILDQLLDGRVHVRRMEPAAAEAGALAGLRIVLTGGLERMTRSAAKELLEAHGAQVTSAVSRKTDYVVAGWTSRGRWISWPSVGSSRLRRRSEIPGQRRAGLPRPRGRCGSLTCGNNP